MSVAPEQQADQQADAGGGTDHGPRPLADVVVGGLGDTTHLSAQPVLESDPSLHAASSRCARGLPARGRW